MNKTDSQVGTLTGAPQNQSVVQWVCTQIGDDWSRFCSSDELAVIQEATEGLKKAYPWLCATAQQARNVALCAAYPRSRLGTRQADWLSRVIYVIQGRCPEIGSAAREITDLVTTPADPLIADEWIKYAPEGSFFWLLGQLYKSLGPNGSFQPKTGSELFGAIAERFAYLESYKPTAGDYAIEALQGAFVGQMQSAYAWDKKGLPTKGEVTTTAKQLLEKDRKQVPKSGWTKLRIDAGIDFLPAKKAGRPIKTEVDEIFKAKQEFLTKQTKLVNETMAGDWRILLEQANAAFGGKKLFQQDEQERLDDQYGQPRPPDDEDGESK